jgi:outer membrane biosynthesis protein TonB
MSRLSVDDAEHRHKVRPDIDADYIGAGGLANVAAIESMGNAWAMLAGHAVNGVFPLHRYLGGSDRSGVFLTESKRGKPDLALKLVPISAPLAQPQLSRWLAAAGLAHPHLIRILEAGRCQLEGLQYLYAVMEYADQSLAQLLEHRALTEDETREMLVPTLKALAFLHNRTLVQGRLKPSNILVVGDQLKLASDTIRRVGEAGFVVNATSVYDPPDARDGSCSIAGDIWALGVALCEALTRQQPLGLHDDGGTVVLPPDLPPTFRAIVASCLSRRPYDRPKVSELQALVRPTGSAPAVRQPATTVPAPPAIAQPSAAPSAAPVAAVAVVRSSNWLALALSLGAVVVLALGWAAWRAHRINPTPTPPPAQVVPGGASQAPASSPAPSQQSGAPGSSSKIHQEIPDVPRHARQTIHGHIRVSVRVIIDKDGTVYAALADQPGPSRYFEKVAIEAAKKWTFPPSDTDAQRLRLLRFEFTREGTSARAVTPR